MPIQKIQAGRVVNIELGTFVGTKGTIFYDEDDGKLYLSDGHTPGGRAITSGDTGTVITSLANLTDVNVTTTPPTNGQALVYSTSTNQWFPQTIVTDIPPASATVLGGIKISNDFFMDVTHKLYINITALRQYFYLKSEVDAMLGGGGGLIILNYGLIIETPPTAVYDYGLITETPPATTADYGTIP